LDDVEEFGVSNSITSGPALPLAASFASTMASRSVH